MNTNIINRGLDELRAVRRRARLLYWSVAIFSFFANLLMLTGPLYMLQVYDRVLGSRSEETLIALSLLVVFLYAMMGVFDYVRGRIMARIGARFQVDLDRRVFDAVVRKSAVAPDLKTNAGLQDLEAVQRLITSSVMVAAFDIPWTPIFFAAIFLFHPMLGWLAVGGAVVLILITIANQVLSRDSQAKAGLSAQKARSILDQMRNEAETVQAMGMRDATFERWQLARDDALDHQMRAIDVGGTFSSFSKTLRLFLQSAMLGLGAWLVLGDEMTAGAIIAGSILLGRALAPIEVALNQWSLVQRARIGWDNLALLLGAVQPEPRRTKLPKPRARLEVLGLTVVPPGENRAALEGVSFVVEPGQAVGVIGSSGAGKSSLARTLTGVWAPTGGYVRFDGASLEHYGSETLGLHIGYLPQRVQLFDGTIAENIARLQANPDDEKVIAAAKLAAAHELILELPNGYDTVVMAGKVRLSGGQMQRIGLARALYDDPAIVVLDEPNSNLDNIGSQAVNHAIRQVKESGRSVLIMAHRPAVIQECDTLLVLESGKRVAFGPKDEVLEDMVSNHKQIRTRSIGMAGVA
ncbi:MAG: type I secretion system permease/ATPase [Sulfitobacter sp.]|nr:type I secretion system permease/ATPase [Sulfitobacter sp.]